MGPFSNPRHKFCISDTNMLVSKNAKICLTSNAKHKICVTPNAKPQWEPMEYSLRLVPNANFLLWVANANSVFSGIWVLLFEVCKCNYY